VRKKNPPKKTERGGGEKRQNFSLCHLFVGAFAFLNSKKTDKRRGDKKKSTQKLLHVHKKKRTTRKQKNHHVGG